MQEVEVAVCVPRFLAPEEFQVVIERDGSGELHARFQRQVLRADVVPAKVILGTTFQPDCRRSVDVHAADDGSVVEERVDVRGIAFLHAVDTGREVGTVPQEQPFSVVRHIGIHEHATVGSVDGFGVPEVAPYGIGFDRHDLAGNRRVQVHELVDVLHGVAANLVELRVDADFEVVKVLEGIVAVVLLHLYIVDPELREDGSLEAPGFVKTLRVVGVDVVHAFESVDVSEHVAVVHIECHAPGDDRLSLVVKEGAVGKCLHHSRHRFTS